MKLSLFIFSPFVNYLLKFFYLFVLIIVIFGCNQKKSKDSYSSSSSFVLVDDCNFHINTLNPKKVICVGQHTTELMIKLNQKDKIIGWCFPDSKIQPDLPLISNQYPSKEVVLSMKPDFIFSGFLGTFKDERLGSRESLKKIGIETYISTSRCVEGQRPVTYDDFFKDIVNIGKIFNVEERATFLVDSIKQEIKSAKQNIKIQKDSLKILIFSGVYPTGEILVAGGYDISTSIVQEAGGKNIFKQEKKQELITSAEVILEKNPDIIVLKESLSDPNAALTRESLEKNSVLKNLKAVKNKNYVIVTFDSLLPGLNNIDALKKMIKEFYTSK